MHLRRNREAWSVRLLQSSGDNGGGIRLPDCNIVGTIYWIRKVIDLHGRRTPKGMNLGQGVDKKIDITRISGTLSHDIRTGAPH